LGLEHHGLNTLRGERRRGAWHIQNVNACHSRFKGWLQRFRSVATFYLLNYLGWYRALDRNTRTGAQTESLLALAIAARPDPYSTRTVPNHNPQLCRMLVFSLVVAAAR
jgi:hypothetical protein